MNRKTKKLAVLGVLCALAYTAAAVGRLPLVLFLKYDPKDIVLALGGLLLGPLSAGAAALIVSLAELFTLSENGPLGFFMNVVSSCSFACTAGILAQKWPGRRGTAAGLLCGWGCMVLVMLFWNYWIAPVYMGIPRAAVAELLWRAFLPFNLLKGGINAAVTLALYRPVASALERARLL